MARIAYSREAAMQQVSAQSIKTAKLEKGMLFSDLEVVPGTLTNANGEEIPNDKFIFKTTKGLKSMSAREYFKLIPEGDKSLRVDGEDEDKVMIATSFIVKDMEDRLDSNQNKVYPINAYVGVSKFLDNKNKDYQWNELVADGLKEGNTFDPVQNYTIEIQS